MNFNFKQAVVKSGTRSVSESEPILKLTPSMNSFRLNNTAMVMLDLKDGDRVVLLDTFAQGEQEDNDNRFFICKANYTIGDVQQGAVISKHLNAFSYSAMYNTILANDPAVASITTPELVEKGLVIENGAKTNSVKAVSWKLIPYMDGEEVEVADDVERPLYRLVFLREEAYKPRAASEGAEEEEIDETED